MSKIAWGILGWALCACDEPDQDLKPTTQTLQAPIAVPGSWSPPAGVLARGDAQNVARQGPPRIADGGRCASTNPWACSCVHPACSPGLPGTLDFAAFLRRRFPQITAAGGFECCRQNTGDTDYLSVHSIGRAIDLMIPQINGDADNTAGDEVANWLMEHAQEIGVQQIVWDRASWNPTRAPGSRLRPYGGPIPHTDHIHVELNLDGANRRTPFFTSGAIDGGGRCEPRCDGPVVVDADCNLGDCSAFGVTCIADPTPRCVVPECPPRGEGAICLDDTHILGCRDGLPTGEPGNCGMFGSWCSTAGLPAGQARCVLSLCVAGPTAEPYDHRGCSITGGRMLDCFADGTAMEVPCPGGQVCRVTDGGAECGPPEPACPVPPEGAPLDQRTVCLNTGDVGGCINGNIYQIEPCEPGLTCTAEGGPARCAVAACLGQGERRVCEDPHTAIRCDSQGSVALREPCAEGSACVDDGIQARCVGEPVVRADAGADAHLEDPLDDAAPSDPTGDATPEADRGADRGADPDATRPVTADSAQATGGCAQGTHPTGVGWLLLLGLGRTLRRRKVQ